MIRLLKKWWASLNYKFCCSNAYLAAQRHEILVAVEWSNLAKGWEDKWNEC